jgi:carbamoylphosphate synthase small subunit
MTYPLIGNYGVNSLDQKALFTRGFVIEELTGRATGAPKCRSMSTARMKIPGRKESTPRAHAAFAHRGAMKRV